MGERGSISGLTEQQAACLRLAIAGWQNKEIAARLGVSPRTVGNHLAEAYRRLGVSSRRQAARLLGQDDLEPPRPIAEPPEVRLSEPVSPDRGDDRLPGFYRPPPSNPVAITILIGLFAALGMLGLVTLLVWRGYQMLPHG